MILHEQIQRWLGDAVQMMDRPKNMLTKSTQQEFTNNNNVLHEENETNTTRTFFKRMNLTNSVLRLYNKFMNHSNAWKFDQENNIKHRRKYLQRNQINELTNNFTRYYSTNANNRLLNNILMEIPLRWNYHNFETMLFDHFYAIYHICEEFLKMLVDNGEIYYSYIINFIPNIIKIFEDNQHTAFHDSSNCDRLFPHFETKAQCQEIRRNYYSVKEEINGNMRSTVESNIDYLSVTSGKEGSNTIGYDRQNQLPQVKDTRAHEKVHLNIEHSRILLNFTMPAMKELALDSPGQPIVSAGPPIVSAGPPIVSARPPIVSSGSPNSIPAEGAEPLSRTLQGGAWLFHLVNIALHALVTLAFMRVLTLVHVKR